VRRCGVSISPYLHLAASDERELTVRYRRAFLAALGVVGIVATPAAGAGPTIEVSPKTVHAGQSVRAHGLVPGCPSGNEVTLISSAFSHAHDFAGLPAVFARVGAHGGYSVSTRIPAARQPGTYQVAGRCGGGNIGVVASLRVLRPVAATSSCGDVVVHFGHGASGGAHDIRATNVGCATTRAVSRRCVSGEQVTGWLYRSVRGRYTITAGNRRITYIAVGGGGCAA
jgi:hypothetical protein